MVLGLQDIRTVTILSTSQPLCPTCTQLGRYLTTIMWSFTMLFLAIWAAYSLGLEVGFPTGQCSETACKIPTSGLFGKKTSAVLQPSLEQATSLQLPALPTATTDLSGTARAGPEPATSEHPPALPRATTYILSSPSLLVQNSTTNWTSSSLVLETFTLTPDTTSTPAGHHSPAYGRNASATLDVNSSMPSPRMQTATPSTSTSHPVSLSSGRRLHAPEWARYLLALWAIIDIRAVAAPGASDESPLPGHHIYQMGVGPSQELQVFTPVQQIQATLGDKLQFFLFNNHTISRVAFDRPCTPIAELESWQSVGTQHRVLELVVDSPTPQWLFGHPLGGTNFCSGNSMFGVNTDAYWAAFQAKIEALADEAAPRPTVATVRVTMTSTVTSTITMDVSEDL